MRWLLASGGGLGGWGGGDSSRHPGGRDLEDAGGEPEAYKAPWATLAPDSLLVLVGNSCDLDRSVKGTEPGGSCSPSGY